MLGIIDAPDTHLALASFLWDCLPATAGEGAVDWAELVLAESHGILLIDQKGQRLISVGDRVCRKRR
jgi:hypothetical protein